MCVSCVRACVHPCMIARAHVGRGLDRTAPGVSAEYELQACDPIRHGFRSLFLIFGPFSERSATRAADGNLGDSKRLLDVSSGKGENEGGPVRDPGSASQRRSADVLCGQPSRRSARQALPVKTTEERQRTL